MKNKQILAAATICALSLLSSCGGDSENNNTTSCESEVAVSAEGTLSISDNEELPKSSEDFTTISNPVTSEVLKESSVATEATEEKTELNKENEAAESRLELPKLDDDYIFITTNDENLPDKTEKTTEATDHESTLYKSSDTSGAVQAVDNSVAETTGIITTNGSSAPPASNSSESTLKPPVTEKFCDDNEPIILPEL